MNVRARFVGLLRGIEDLPLRESESPALFELSILSLEHVLERVVWCRGASRLATQREPISLREAYGYEGVSHSVRGLLVTDEAEQLRSKLNK